MFPSTGIEVGFVSQVSINAPFSFPESCFLVCTRISLCAVHMHVTILIPSVLTWRTHWIISLCIIHLDYSSMHTDCNVFIHMQCH